MARIQVSKHKEYLMTAEDHVNQVKKSVQEWIMDEKLNMLQLVDNLPILVSGMVYFCKLDRITDNRQ